MWLHATQHFNFYRIHLLCFICIPLLFAAIFYASNGRFKISFIDALFVCVSAATGTGLSTIDLSSLTAWQQTILVILELAGNQVFVSWIIVYIRRSYYRQHLGHIVTAEVEKKRVRRSAGPTIEQTQARSASITHERNPPGKRLHPGMVRRIDTAPRLINPMGVPARSRTIEEHDIESSPEFGTSSSHDARPHKQHLRLRNRDRISTQTSMSERPTEVGFGGFPWPQEILSLSSRKMFPNFHRNIQRTLTIPRTATLIPQQRDSVIASDHRESTRPVGYFSFVANVEDNSRFYGLTEEQIVELGGVEYRALNALLWITPLYYFGLLAISIIIITPYMTLPRWRSIFLPPEQHRKLSPIWFSVFQIVGAWANTGLSLVDQNMIPFRTAYLMIIVLIFCVLAGNTAFPIFFRFAIWTLSKAFPASSRTREALHFLLDHPRRCFISLFPSPQTWLLTFILCVMNVVLLGGDLILNLGNAAVEVIPVGTRVALAFLSSAAVRSAGFQGIPVSSLTPATQVLYIVMMYIAIYPIAISVRATNVYEERSLGIYHDEESADTDEDLDTPDNRVNIWGRYLMRHVRKQLSFDMWWLALSLFLVCIIERHKLMDTNNSTWFNIFAILFEIVSGYGTVGLSLGIPTANYSLSGAFHVLSKLIICAVMLRGRHRGLPVALDRAVLLPHEFRRDDNVAGSNETSSQNMEEKDTKLPLGGIEEAGSSTRGSSSSTPEQCIEQSGDVK